VQTILNVDVQDHTTYKKITIDVEDTRGRITKIDMIEEYGKRPEISNIK
jgi:hypothetical protein